MSATWEQVETALDGILDRRWYTNHGPLAKRLEAECAEASEHAAAIVVTNPTIGLIMLADALELAGEVLLSPFAPPRALHSLQWAGLRPRFVDIDPLTLGLDPDQVLAAISSETTALLATAGAGGVAAMAAQHGLTVYRDTVAGEIGPQLIALGGVGEDAGAACILTDDPRLAARLRNIRSSYGAGPPVPVVRTANGRLSEAQAAMALLIPPNARLRHPDPPSLPQCRSLAYGTDLLVVAEDATAFARLTQHLRDADIVHTPLRLDARARHCVEAARAADRTVIVQAAGLAKLASG